MAEQQIPDVYTASEADAAEQALAAGLGVDMDLSAREGEEGEGARSMELPFEADPADAVEQAAAVPVDEEEYR